MANFFLVGLVMGPLLFLILSGSDLNITPVSNGPMFYLAALLIGLGTSIGSGCTSGHGICGLARFSLRSLIAVLTFMFVGVLTVYFSTLMKWFIQ
ncbi:MAG: YeeE/YedE thiosulfate transporter family protein [Paracoccaceae bacterium]|nr:YeeE/YedE thiosulfate transporter family protein [Paracoccaceae bacterium]